VPCPRGTAKEGTTVQPGINRVKTWILIAALGGLFVLIGAWIGGPSGAVWALGFALLFNVGMYWFSDRIAIATTRSKPVTEQEQPALYRIVRELTQARNLPMPAIYVSAMTQPNAFATGRNPKHAAVSVTAGILQLLDERELRGVLAHELSHVANRDILISSIAAAIGMSITFLARFAFFFGGGDDNRGGNGFAMLFAWILAPIAAAIIQMAVSRSREYQADESGAYLSHDPEALTSALRKLEVGVQRVPPPASVSPAEAHLFIMNPMAALKGRGFANLFSTHPPTEERIARLEAIGQELRGGSPISGV
jgi:heat shock protein HtpX